MKRLLFLILGLLLLNTGIIICQTGNKMPDMDIIEKTLTEEQLWFNNSIGITEKVPRPWTPVKTGYSRSGEITLDMLGRTYHFRDSLFPSFINTWDEEILASPVILTMTLDKKYTVKAQTTRIVSKKTGKVTLISYGSIKDVDFHATHHVEFDGMIWTKITVTAAKNPVAIKNLALEIPLKRNVAKYLNHNHYYSEARSMNYMGVMEKLPFSSPFKPSIWMGNERIGFCWFAESDEGWDRKGPLNKQIEIHDRGAARILTLNFINSMQILDLPREISFGMMATPPKPVKENWRSHTALFTPIFLAWNWDKGDYYPEPDPQIVESERIYDIIEKRAYFKTSFNYFAATFRDGTVTPEYYLFGRKWERIGPTEKEMAAQTVPPGIFAGKGATRGSPASSQANWLIWKWQNLIKKFGMRDIYFDSLGNPDINRLHGAGYIDENGDLQPVIPIMAMRKALQRFYIMLSENVDDFNIMIHGASSVPPVLSFAHAHLSGEQFICAPRQVGAHLSEIAPDEEWIGYFMGKQFGVVGVFLPAWRDRNARLIVPTEEMMMLTLLHDIPVMPAFCHGGTVKTVQNALISFGMENMEFIPYWESSAYAKTDDKNFRISIYADKTDKDRMILIIGNMNRSAGIASVKLKNPNGSNLKIEDLLNGEVFTADNEKVDVNIKQLNFRLLAVSP